MKLNIAFLDGSDGVYQYTGKQIIPNAAFYMDNGNQISAKQSLKVTYGANIELGKGTVTIVGLGDEGTNWKYN